MWSSKGLRYLVEEALAKLVHGTLQLAALALPLLIVAHRLGCGPLPCRGSGVVVHIVEPAPLVHSLLPAGGCWRGHRNKVEVKNAVVFNNIFIKHVQSGRLYQKVADNSSNDLWKGGKETGARKGKKTRRLLVTYSQERKRKERGENKDVKTVKM